MSKIIEDLENLDATDAVDRGSAAGYTLWDILSFDGAQEFIVRGTDKLAGEAYIQNEEVFYNNIRESQPLYFFTLDNTNEVVCGVVANTNDNYQTLSIEYSNNHNDTIRVNVDLNIMFENACDETSAILNLDELKNLPLYLIPEFKVINQSDEFSKLGLIVKNNTLVAVLPNIICNPNNIPEELDLTKFESINQISNYAFKWFPEAYSTIIINNKIKNITKETFAGIQKVKVVELEDDDSWNSDWTSTVSSFEYGCKLSRDDYERLKNEKEDEKSNFLRYRVVGKEITILGLKSPSTYSENTITIPETIKGKPVTVISSYAFYGMESVKKFYIPKTVKRIEQGAFSWCDFNAVVYVPKDCLVSDKYNIAQISRY